MNPLLFLITIAASEPACRENPNLALVCEGEACHCLAGETQSEREQEAQLGRIEERE